MRITLLHNPGAGLSKPSKEDIIDALETSGYQVRYQSLKDKPINWVDIDRSSTIIVVAGGDGTVGKISRKLVGSSVPIGILPTGTANNIAVSLGIMQKFDKIIPQWDLSRKRRLSVGQVQGRIGKNYFVESVGFGLFTHLMKDVYGKSKGREKGTPEEEIKQAVNHLLRIIEEFKPQYYEVNVDGKDLSGFYLMVEVMNIKCIGPNLMLAPIANHEDEAFEVVLIGDKEKGALIEYFKGILNDQKVYLNVPYHNGRNILVRSEFSEVHVDDQVIEGSAGDTFAISQSLHFLQFLV